MEFSVIVLGSSSAIPTVERGLSAQLVIHGGDWFLVDCGEGTQMQMRRFHLNFNRISKVFISHLHADHFLGLPGLLSTMGLLGRQKELEVYALADLQDFLKHFERISGSGLKFPVKFFPLQTLDKNLMAETENLKIWSFPLKHKVPTTGFLFAEKPRPRKIRKEWLELEQPTLEDIQRIKAGEPYRNAQGRFYAYDEITEAAPAPRSYAYCSDTAYCETLPEWVQEPTLLYHEATFTQEHAARAKETLHATAEEAARTALACRAHHLLLGHFSVRYPSPAAILEEARRIFPKTLLAQDGVKYTVSENPF
ncbi:MAG: ribonuclease Z [Flavobacteriales bacterium]|nr:ribonuclease Z [Flavobacteriales bacterium]MDW8432642.1 ribonuclease Z [Flavobacteriales bacterium]